MKFFYDFSFLQSKGIQRKKKNSLLEVNMEEGKPQNHLRANLGECGGKLLKI